MRAVFSNAANCDGASFSKSETSLGAKVIAAFTRFHPHRMAAIVAQFWRQTVKCFTVFKTPSSDRRHDAFANLGHRADVDILLRERN